MYMVYMYIEKKYSGNCFMMTMYQSLLSASLLCSQNLGPEELQSKCTETKLLKCSLKVLNDNLPMPETQQLILLTCTF